MLLRTSLFVLLSLPAVAPALAIDFNPRWDLGAGHVVTSANNQPLQVRSAVGPHFPQPLPPGMPAHASGPPPANGPTNGGFPQPGIGHILTPAQLLPTAKETAPAATHCNTGIGGGLPGVPLPPCGAEFGRATADNPIPFGVLPTLPF